MTEPIKVQEHWDEKADVYKDSQVATHGDIYLRELEVNAILKHISDCENIIDVGCGNGFSTFRFAKENPDKQFLGVDYSKSMLEIAKESLNKSKVENIDFSPLDITQEVPENLKGKFDLVITERCLINLVSHEMHLKALENLGELLKPGGRMVLSEESIQSYQAINGLRKEAGLSDMSIQWHNLYLDMDRIPTELPVSILYDGYEDFSSTYYLGTRLFKAYFYEKQGWDPGADVTGDFNEMASKIPSVGDFGLIKLYFFSKI